MTVPSEQTPRKSYDGNGVTTEFSITFKFMESDGSDVKVYLIDSNGNETLQVEGTDYTIDVSASTITMATAPATGERLALHRDTVLDQQLDLVNNDSYDADLLEAALDKSMLAIKEIEDRSLKISANAETSVDGTLPLPEASRALVWNSAGDAIENGPTTNEISNAQTYATNAATSETNAAASEAKAQKWAEEAEDVEVETGKYSAKHWAAKAAADAASINLPSIGAGDADKLLQVKATEDGYNLVTADSIAGLPDDFITGLIISVNSVDSAHDIDISTGVCRDSTNAETITLASALTKQIDAAWAVGTNAGGLDGTESVAGTPDASSIHNVFIIKRSDTSVVDICFSRNSPATGPSIDGTPIPTAYNSWRWIGWVLTDASGNIKGFKITGKERVLRYDYNERLTIASGLTNSAYTSLAVSSYIPTTDGNIMSVLFGGLGTGAATDYVMLSDDGVNAKTTFGVSISSNGIGQVDELYYTRAAGPCFVPLNGNNIYYSIASNYATTLFIRAAIFSR